MARPPNPVAQQLQEIGVRSGYAYDLANGKRTPSLRMAREIEAQIGIPLSAWPLRKPTADSADTVENTAA